MDLAEVNKNLDNIDTGLASYVQLADLRIQAVQAKGDRIALQLIENVNIRTAAITMSLQRAANLLLLRAGYGTLRLTIHSSPELIALTLTILWIYRAVQFILFVTKILNILAVLWRIHQIVAALWPEYRASWERLMSSVSEISGYIGWGVDGIGHLVNAVSGGINVLGGVMGKDWNLMRFEMMEKGNELVIQMSRMLAGLKDDPGRVLNQLFENRTLLVADDTSKWWMGVSEWISDAVDTAQTALTGVQGITNELLAIQNNMPEEVRKNIPDVIWSTLADTNTMISTKIFPRIWMIENSLKITNNLIGSLSTRASELAVKLAHPGDILLGVDELPDYMKKYQEGLIDDVTSREFNLWADLERDELGADLNEFDRIDRLATAPTPEPTFLTMEVPVGKTIRGITAEYKENWFVGDY